MAEKLTIVLTDRDLEVIPSTTGGKEIIEYLSQCPLCQKQLILTRIRGDRCLCDIEWGLDIKIKGVRSHTDEERQQLSIPFKTTA